MECFATCPAGFERLLADELAELGAMRTRPLRGQVAFEAELGEAYRICLWSRIASRVVCVLARISANDADALYEGVSSLAWEDHLALGSSFAVDAHGTNASLRNTQFVALRSKDAIVDRMVARTGARPATNTAHPDLTVVVRVSRERATVGIDLAGEPLFRRGYEAVRSGRAPIAPLRPDYAAAMLAAGAWKALCAGTTPTLVVPFVGAGTLAVEAAGIALDRAPGLLRQRWGFKGWMAHSQTAWDEVLAEAHERANAGAAESPELLLSDVRSGAETQTRQALRAAGTPIDLCFSREGLPKTTNTGAALLACDLSWLEPDAVAVQAAALARLSSAAEELPQGSRVVLLSPDTSCDAVLGRPETTVDVIVGRSDATMRTYVPSAAIERPAVALPGGTSANILVPTSDQFARRLAKVTKARRKWAQREGVTCYRVYDADLPDYAVSIDLFEGIDGERWLQVYEYAPPKDIDANLARKRLLDVVSIAPKILDVSPENTFVRVRTRARGGSQYAGEARQPRDARPPHGRHGGPALPSGAHLIDEGGLTFEVNFQMRLDCGIFLDHRDTRAMLREMAKQTKGSKRFLNLFAYTGTATCYAADGGMKHTTTVDLSRPSLEWAERNMERNGFVGQQHEYVQADVVRWVSEQRRTRNRWDLIFCDVPTFSNSRRMRSSSFDVQRDHTELLIGVSRLLTREGTCVFSCNLRGFKPDETGLAKAGVTIEDITSQTIPEDFSRNPKIHHCYLVKRG